MSDAKDLKYYSQRLREELTGRGALGLGKILVSNLKRRAIVTNKSTWYRLCLNGDIPITKPKVLLSYDLMSLDEATSFFEKNHESFPWMFIEREMEAARQSGHMFPCLRDEDRVIGYIKLGIGQVYILDFERVLHLPPTAAIIYDSFITPAYRKKGLGTFIISMTANLAKEKGFRTMWCQIPSWNAPSIKMFRTAGFEAFGEVRLLRLMGKEFYHQRPEQFLFLENAVPRGSGELRLSEACAG